jgi:hypothetical protein
MIVVMILINFYFRGISPKHIPPATKKMQQKKKNPQRNIKEATGKLG